MIASRSANTAMEWSNYLLTY